MRHNERLSRQMRLVVLLARSPRGLSSEALARALGCSRATVNRDLGLLRGRVGLHIEPTRVNGEVWHRLEGVPLRVAVSPLQLAALGLARAALEPLAGTALVRELGALAAALPMSGSVRLDGRRKRAPSPILASIEQAITTGHRMKIEVRVASRGGERRTYVLEPITVRLTEGETYLDAWSLESDALRTFKVARIRSAEILPERAAPHSDVDLDAVFRAAVKTWSGDIERVRVRIAAAAAWAVSEYPLIAGQRVRAEPSGSVVVEAEVAGLVEASRWVLTWGRNAEALSPPQLRELVCAELRGALDRYQSSDAPAEARSHMVSGPDAPAPPAGRPSSTRSTARTAQVRGRG